MQSCEKQKIRSTSFTLSSRFLERDVLFDVYLPEAPVPGALLSLLLLNDGQDLRKLNFKNLLEDLQEQNPLLPLMCVGIHASTDRKMEYGTAGTPDYEGRGARAQLYSRFVREELLPFIQKQYRIKTFRQQAVAGFSLGGLTALDMAWQHPELFSIAGVFSGSLWWRSRALDAGYDEDSDRIMHARVRAGTYRAGLRFYFTTGSLDETADRNGNGIIDSIDDTLGLIEELEKKGYNTERDIFYINYDDGRHDVETWGRALPQFLQWAFASGAV